MCDVLTRLVRVMSPWLFDRWRTCRTCVPDEQRKSRHVQLRYTEVTATAAGHQGADHVSCMSGPSQEHDLPLWTWYMPDVWGPHVWVPHLSQAGRETHSPVLRPVKYEEYLCHDVGQAGWVTNLKHASVTSKFQPSRLVQSSTSYCTGKPSSFNARTSPKCRQILELYEFNSLCHFSVAMFMKREHSHIKMKLSTVFTIIILA